MRVNDGEDGRFNAVQNNTSLKQVQATYRKFKSFNAVQNNTSLKPICLSFAANTRFNAVQNNTSIKLKMSLQSMI